MPVFNKFYLEGLKYLYLLIFFEIFLLLADLTKFSVWRTVRFFIIALANLTLFSASIKLLAYPAVKEPDITKSLIFCGSFFNRMY